MCPAVLDLSGKRHALCHMKTPYGTVRYDVSIDDVNGWREVPLDDGVDGRPDLKDGERRSMNG